jgi:CheY-like chemotaxis protein
MSKKIAIIDDDASILEAIDMLLTSEGYNVRTCTNGDCFLERQDFSPDLVLLDLLLSGKDGRLVIKELRKKPLTRDVPVVIMSAHTMKAEDKAVEGAQEFLPKPFDIDKLLELVKKYTD